jgi:hypothetical protein
MQIKINSFYHFKFDNIDFKLIAKNSLSDEYRCKRSLHILFKENMSKYFLFDLLIINNIKRNHNCHKKFNILLYF